jgi:hypothetical protein
MLTCLRQPRSLKLVIDNSVGHTKAVVELQGDSCIRFQSAAAVTVAVSEVLIVKMDILPTHYAAGTGHFTVRASGMVPASCTLRWKRGRRLVQLSSSITLHMVHMLAARTV